MEIREQARLQFLKARLNGRLRRAQEGEYLRQVLPTLRAERVRCRRVNLPEINRALAPISSMKARGERPDWSCMSEARCEIWDDRSDRDRIFRKAVKILSTPEERLVVVWHSHAAGLRIGAASASRLASPLLDASPLVWIVPDDSPRWLIEVARMDRELCFGPLPKTG